MKKLKSWTKVLLWLGGLFVGFIILGAIIGPRPPAPNAETARPQETAEKPAAETGEAMYRIGADGGDSTYVPAPAKPETEMPDKADVEPKAAPPARLDATVLRVVDFCTIEVKLDDGKVETVRLLGIDAAKPEPEWAARAKEELECELMQGGVKPGLGSYPYLKRVALVIDPKCPQRDEKGRLLAHVHYFDKISFDSAARQGEQEVQNYWKDFVKFGLNNAQTWLIQGGVVKFQTKYQLSKTMTKQYQDDEKIAKENGEGIWEM